MFHFRAFHFRAWHFAQSQMAGGGGPTPGSMTDWLVHNARRRGRR